MAKPTKLDISSRKQSSKLDISSRKQSDDGRGNISLTDDDEKFCRICFDVELDECVVSPCKCKRNVFQGSLGFVHLSCLQRWLEQSRRSSCELCNTIFHTKRFLRYSAMQSLWYWFVTPRESGRPAEFRRLKCDMIMGLVMASLCFGGTYLSVLAVDHLSRTHTHDIIVARWTSVSFLLLVILFTTSFYLWMNSSVILHEFDWFSWWQDQVTIRIIPPHRGEDSQNEMSGSDCDDEDDDDDQNRTESSRDILREMTTGAGGFHYETTELSLLQKSPQNV